VRETIAAGRSFLSICWMGLLLAFPTIADAVTVAEVVEVCDGRSKEEFGLCAGYFMGAVDARNAMGHFRGELKDCRVPISYARVRDAVLPVMRKHPSKTDPAGPTIVLFLEKAFPCSKP